jgi:hypothetical protein
VTRTCAISPQARSRRTTRQRLQEGQTISPWATCSDRTSRRIPVSVQEDPIARFRTIRGSCTGSVSRISRRKFSGCSRVFFSDARWERGGVDLRAALPLLIGNAHSSKMHIGGAI